ncbi:hypothetical protein AgCh_032141 [Apium graveolens]
MTSQIHLTSEPKSFGSNGSQSSKCSGSPKDASKKRDDNKGKDEGKKKRKSGEDVKGTPVLKLSSKTIQVLQRIPDLSRCPPSPLGNLNFLYLRGQGPEEKPVKSTDHVIHYLLSNSPSVEILIAIEKSPDKDINPYRLASRGPKRIRNQLPTS